MMMCTVSTCIYCPSLRLLLSVVSSSHSCTTLTTDDNGSIDPIRRRSLGSVCYRQPIGPEGLPLLQRYHSKGVPALNQHLSTIRPLQVRRDQRQFNPTQHCGSNEPKPECDYMRPRKLECDKGALPLGVVHMQRPYPLVQSDLVHERRHFQCHYQPNLRPGSLQRDSPCIL
jgi:hypothetical protein